MYLIITWVSFFPEANFFSLKRVIFLFFNYPDIYQQLFYPWFKGMPALTASLMVLIIFLYALTLYRIKTGNVKNRNIVFILTILLILLIGVSLIKTPYRDVRYTFFLYPVILLTFTYSIYEITLILSRNTVSRQVLFGGTVILFMIFTKDFNFRHLFYIDSPEVTYRINYTPKEAEFYFWREDYKSPSEMVNENASENDIIISTLDLPVYYLKKMDYIYRSLEDREFDGISRDHGKKELWTNANLIYK